LRKGNKSTGELATCFRLDDELVDTEGNLSPL
jgi:hypothetical protein